MSMHIRIETITPKIAEMRDLVKECGLDWQRGYTPLFDGDPTNREQAHRLPHGC